MRWPKCVVDAFVIAYFLIDMVKLEKRVRIRKLKYVWLTGISKHEAMCVEILGIEWMSISYVGCWYWYESEWNVMKCWGTKHECKGMSENICKEAQVNNYICFLFLHLSRVVGKMWSYRALPSFTILCVESVAILHNVSLCVFLFVIQVCPR